MKKAIFLFVFALITTCLLAQTGYNNLKKENELLKNVLLLKPVTEAQIGDLNFSIIKVEGNSKTKLVTIEILIKNKGTKLEAFSSKVMSIIDLDCIEYPVHKAFLGTKDATIFAFTDLYNFSPLTCTYIFKGITPDVKFIKLFKYPMEYHIPGAEPFDFQNKKAEFRDLSIAWK